MDTREPRGPKVLVVSIDGPTPKPKYDWTTATVLTPAKVRAYAVDDVRRLLSVRGKAIADDGPEGAALVAAMEAYLART